MLVDTASLRTWLWSISRTNKSPEGLWVGGVLQFSQLTAASDAHYHTLSGKSPSNSAIRAKWSSSRSHSCKAQVTTLRQWKIVKTNKTLRVWIMPKGLSLMMPYGVDVLHSPPECLTSPFSFFGSKRKSPVASSKNMHAALQTSHQHHVISYSWISICMLQGCHDLSYPFRPTRITRVKLKHCQHTSSNCIGEKLELSTSAVSSQVAPMITWQKHIVKEFNLLKVHSCEPQVICTAWSECHWWLDGSPGHLHLSKLLTCQIQ